MASNVSGFRTGAPSQDTGSRLCDDSSSASCLTTSLAPVTPERRKPRRRNPGCYLLRRAGHASRPSVAHRVLASLARRGLTIASATKLSDLPSAFVAAPRFCARLLAAALSALPASELAMGRPEVMSVADGRQ